MTTKLTNDMSFDDYRAITAVNWSTLKYMARSPLHYHHADNHPTGDTPRLAIGRAVHTAVLEPDAFPLRYVVYDADRRGNAWAEFKEANAGRSILKRDEYARCIAMRDAVHAHELAASLLYGLSEVVAEWTDERTGIGCKARLDHLNADGELIDLKTTSSVDSFEFERLSARMLYHCQLAFYRRPVTEHRPRIIAVEYDPPHDVAVFRLTDDAMYAGDQHVDELLNKLAVSRELGRWSGRYADEQDLTIPPWLLDEAGDVTYGMTIGGVQV